MTAEPVESDAIAPYKSTLRYMEILHGEWTRLRAAQVEAEEQLLHRVACDVSAGKLRVEDLPQLYVWLRSVATDGHHRRWTASGLPISASKAQGEAAWHAKNLPGPDGTWSGTWPLDEQAVPTNFVSVVYVLFDAQNEPCYVGSTYKFRQRLKRHHCTGKRFNRWMAYPCASREAAYQLEKRLLQEHKPYLNKNR